MPIAYFQFIRTLISLHFIYYTFTIVPYFDIMYGDQAAALSGVHGKILHWNWLFLLLFWLRFAAAIGVLFAWKRQALALVIYACSVGLYLKNTLTQTPEIYYLNWLTIMLAILPDEKDRRFQLFSVTIMRASWVVLSICFLRIAYEKIKISNSPWINGSALLQVFSHSDIRHPYFSTWLAMLPDIFLKIASWSLLFTQLAALPCMFFKSSRAIWWFTTFLIHFSGFLFLEIQQVSSGMSILLLFIAPLAFSNTLFFSRLRNSQLLKRLSFTNAAKEHS